MSINISNQTTSVSNVPDTVAASGSQPLFDPKAITDKVMSTVTPILEQYMKMDIKNQTRIRTILENALNNETNPIRQLRILVEVQSAKPKQLAAEVVNLMLDHVNHEIDAALLSGDLRKAAALVPESRELAFILIKMTKGL